MSRDTPKPLDLRIRLTAWLLGALERWTLSLVPRGAVRRRVLQRIDRAFAQLPPETCGNPATPGVPRQSPTDRRRVL